MNQQGTQAALQATEHRQGPSQTTTHLQAAVNMMLSSHGNRLACQILHVLIGDLDCGDLCVRGCVRVSREYVLATFQELLWPHLHAFESSQTYTTDQHLQMIMARVPYTCHAQQRRPRAGNTLNCNGVHPMAWLSLSTTCMRFPSTVSAVVLHHCTDCLVVLNTQHRDAPGLPRGTPGCHIGCGARGS